MALIPQDLPLPVPLRRPPRRPPARRPAPRPAPPPPLRLPPGPLPRSRAKRALDLALTVPGLVLTGPGMLLIAAAVRLDSPGPALFRQERVGLGGRPFCILKFRTMGVDAARQGGPLTVGEDRRITRVGRWLRALKLDELPQLLNVLRGEMSLVGPRPELRHYTDLYTAQQRRVLELVPGITGPASIAYCDESALLARFADPERAYVEHIMPHKIALHLAYAERATLLSDVGVLLRTLARLLHP
jgi:lipopolysaccharide/colanic/teichoic acid biosynthesis glycosyltransferase